MKEAFFYLFTSFWAGATHAATPGHGKTIAAAYIVGARGRPVDAVILGVFVTLSHVSGIILVGVLASLGTAWFAPQRLEAYLGLGMGLIVTGLGAWILWTQRDLIGPALAKPEHDHHGHDHGHDGNHHHAHDYGHAHDHDHQHVDEPALAGAEAEAFGHPHSHNHGAEDGHVHSHEDGHHHDHEHGHDHDHGHDHHHGHAGEEATWHRHGWGTYHSHRLDVVTDRRPGLAALLALGIAGGLLPDPTALALLLAALSSGQVMLGLATVLVFSLGFASTLVIVGIIAAKVGEKVLQWLSNVWMLRLQLGTTAVILGIGLVLTVRALLQIGALPA
jgi:nickel/cobalt exporter